MVSDAMRYFYCAKCEKPVDSPNGEHFRSHGGYDLGSALRAGLADRLTETDYRRLTLADERREAKLQAYNYRAKHSLAEPTAWSIVVDVWNKLKEEQFKRNPWHHHFWMPPIKAGQRKDARFYRALQTVLWDTRSVPDDEHMVIALAGAPSHVCERDGLFFSDRKGAPPRLWVYFNIDNERRARERALQVKVPIEGITLKHATTKEMEGRK